MRQGFNARWLAAMLIGLSLPAACAKEATQGTVPPAQGATRDVEPSARAGPVKIVFLGDSLTEGYGLEPADAFPSVIQQRLREKGLDAEVVNAGVSGDTSAGGLRRVDWSLDADVRILVVALGGNDALRGLSTAELQRNLGAIIERARRRHVTVILAGMEAPPNLGHAYTSAFHRVYSQVAEQYGVTLVPFLLDGVAGNASLNQADGIHPNPAGARKVADLVWPYLERALREAGRGD